MKQNENLQIAMLSCFVAVAAGTIATNVFSLALEGIKPFQAKEKVSAATRDDFRSLLAITARQLREVQQIVQEAELFEVGAYLQPEGGVLVASGAGSLFSSPYDDQRYVYARDDLDYLHQRHYYSTRTEAFVVRKCEGAIALDCDQPTGQPEARQGHPPIQEWKIDISDLERIWKEKEIEFPLRGSLMVTTVGRYRYRYAAIPGHRDKETDRLMQLPDGQAIMVVKGPAGGFNPQNQTTSGPYLVLNAQSGEILVRATYVVPPRRP